LTSILAPRERGAILTYARVGKVGWPVKKGQNNPKIRDGAEKSQMPSGGGHASAG